ncbi:MAG: hypothetical protein H0X14_03805 [Acidobacteria bacterium]|nr:hypothetical protein [Acidobacteriota bacterium]
MQIAFLIITVFFNTLVFGQTVQEPAPNPKPQEQSITSRQITDLPLLRRTFRPKITLQKALKIAESYVKKRKINVSSYYLLEARMIRYGSESGVKEPRWFFLWAHEHGVIGNEIQVSVSMNGKAAVHPSM